MRKHKSQRHHWWPVCVSTRWADAGGCVNWLLPSGEVRRAPPDNFGVIRNGHLIQIGRVPGEETVWDQDFEPEFQRADNAFPPLIDWLEQLDRPTSPTSDDGGTLFKAQNAGDAQLQIITECLVSLAVRSPMNRGAAVGLAEHLRGPLPERERNSLIGLNMRNDQRAAVMANGSRGKYAVIFSPHRELIFGDGFFHNVRSPVSGFFSPNIVAPLTPNLAVALVRPTRYMTEPRLVTMVATAEQAEVLNNAVQVYARDALFYRSEKPALEAAFREGQHMTYDHPGNPVDMLLRQIPGIPPRDTSLDHLFFRRSH